MIHHFCPKSTEINLIGQNAILTHRRKNLQENQLPETYFQTRSFSRNVCQKSHSPKLTAV